MRCKKQASDVKHLENIRDAWLGLYRPGSWPSAESLYQTACSQSLPNRERRRIRHWIDLFTGEMEKMRQGELRHGE